MNEEKKLRKAQGGMDYQLEMLQESLRTGITELLILSILTRGEAYGYDIYKKIVTETDGAFNIFHTAIYTYLRRLIAKNFIEVRHEQAAVASVSRRMVIYGITDAGREYLEEGKKLYRLVTRKAEDILF